MKTEIIIASYNKPEHLHAVFRAIGTQTMEPASICIADDGSGSSTHEKIRLLIKASRVDVRVVSQEDRGFRKNTILNKAINSSTADYLIFLDDDDYISPNHVFLHTQKRKPKHFVVGSVIRLNSEKTEFILSGGSPKWAGVRMLDWPPNGINQALKMGIAGPRISKFLDQLTPIKARWKGGNTSAFRSDVLSVGGFNETMGYGGEDKELGLRLNLVGIHGIQAKYSIPVYHLDHDRDYVFQATIESNKNTILKLKKSKQ